MIKATLPKFITFIALCLALAACDSLIAPEPEIAALPTLTASPFMSATPAVGEAVTATPSTPTATSTITLTPVLSPTPLFAALPTFSAGDLSAVPGSTELPGPRPKINYFVSFPTSASPGETVLLFWSTADATSAAVTRILEGGKRGKSFSVSVEGSITITVDAQDRNQEYLLSITNGIMTVTKSLTIEVKCDLPWFFVPFPDTGCQDGDPSFGAGSVVNFERGKMAWIGPLNQIVVLFSDAPTRPAWLMISNPFQDGMPEDDGSISAPEGLRVPRRGFLYVWRDTPGLAERIGFALDDETPYGIIYAFERGEDRRLYFSDPASAVIGLAPNGVGWQVVGQVGTPTPQPAP